MSDFLPATTSTDEAARHARIAVLPVGSFEQHGSHLPLATDSMIACVIAREVALHYDLFLLPPVTISCSHEHAAWPGTVSISSATLRAVVTDIASSLAHSGIEHLLVVSGHGGNYVLSNVAQEASIHGPRIAVFPTSAEWRSSRAAAGITSDAHDDMHAGELETSILLHTHPEVVRPSYAEADEEAAERPHMLTRGLRAYTKSGVVGRPSLASADKGKAALVELISAAGGHIDALLDT